MKRYVILHNVRSAHNVGSVFRSADGAGVAKVFLTGYTPLPIDRFGRVQPEIEKTSLGAAQSVPWEHVPEILDVIQALKAEGVLIAAVEQHSAAIHYFTHRPKGDVAYIFGNEVEGVPYEVCDVADVILVIPMYGSKESLNVAVAAGIILFNTGRSLET